MMVGVSWWGRYSSTLSLWNGGKKLGRVGHRYVIEAVRMRGCIDSDAGDPLQPESQDLLFFGEVYFR